MNAKVTGVVGLIGGSPDSAAKFSWTLVLTGERTESRMRPGKWDAEFRSPLEAQNDAECVALDVGFEIESWSGFRPIVD